MNGDPSEVINLHLCTISNFRSSDVYKSSLYHIAGNEFCSIFLFSGEIKFFGRIRRGNPFPGFGSRVRVCSLPLSPSLKAESCLKRDVHKQRSSLESMFCYDKPIPEEIIDEPVGLSISEREIGDNQRCSCCEAKGALLCATCSGTGLYVDSIMESQGIIVKVRCLGCGGTGNIMCKSCGGRGHVGH